jgi:predicted helicase
MQKLNLRPNHAPVKAYYEALHGYGQLHIDHEMAVRSAFQDLLSTCGRKVKLTLVPEFRIERARSSVIVDGALLDIFHLAHGYWEAKDEKDDLNREVKAKLEKGYPRDNIIFQAPERAILYQGGARVADEDISRADYLSQVVNQFFDYKAAYIQEWEEAVGEFSERIPELAKAVFKIIEQERPRNPEFVRSFDDFYALCRQSINPNLSQEAVERMLVQHLLTERIFRKIFNNPDFTRRNVVAQEIEKVITALTSRAFDRDQFLSSLDRFYRAIEISAENTTGFSEKQAFLNKVYERFFQGYSPKEADTHGIVYTPQPIVNFMVRSVEEILRAEFGRSLGDKGVHILDPFIGTGNFIVRIMQEIKATELPYKYENELHCNEVMLLPYYIASMNIEHAYFERTGEYKAFPGICLVDTFELAEADQAGLFTEANTQRVERQKRTPIFVVIGNPPYNMGQVNENDNNRNRKYPKLDERIATTYSKDSSATSKSALADPYVKAIRWASDRIGEDGLVAFVTNNGFLDSIAADGMRKHLARDFQSIFVLDLGGNVRRNPKLSGTTHNVFGIQVGVSINLFVRRSARRLTACKVFYSRVDEFWKKEQKYNFLEEIGHFSALPRKEFTNAYRLPWSAGASQEAYEHFLPIGSFEAKEEELETGVLFRIYSRGAETTRDRWLYNFSESELKLNLGRFIETYNTEVQRWSRRNSSANIDVFLLADERKIKWSSRLKQLLEAGVLTEFHPGRIRVSLYRPFATQLLYFDDVLMHRRGRLPEFFPTGRQGENRLIWVKVGAEWPSFALASDRIPDLLPAGGSQCFSFYTYAEDGTDCRENITDWGLEQFRSHYDDRSISKWDIFHYVYAVLHHPDYRLRYAANLRRELPRIPFVPAEVFTEFVTAGQRLTCIHVDYEKQPEYTLTKTEKSGEKLNWRVTRMRLSKDKTSLIYNDFLTLSGIPKETYDYRLGNRSALEWVIDQYQVSTDKRSGITNDPNRPDDPQYILRLIGQVISVSLETVKIVQSLPELGIETATAKGAASPEN